MIIVVIALLLVGTGTNFAYEKIFKEDKQVEESQDNIDNNENTVNNERVNESDVEVLDYGDKHLIEFNTYKSDIVINNFNNNKFSLKIGDYDNSDNQYQMNIYLNDKLVDNVKIYNTNHFYILDYNNYYIIYIEGTYYQDLFILSDNKIIRSLAGSPYSNISISVNNFNGIISKITYEKKDNFIIEEYTEKIDLNKTEISSKVLSDTVNCKTYTDKVYDCLCSNYFDINKYNSQCS